MVRLALQDYPEFELALLEEDIEGPAYTIDTVRNVRARMNISAENCWLIIGADPLLELESWKDPDALFRDCRLAVLPRPGWDPSLAPKRFLTRARLLDTPEIDISASDIRKKIAAGEPIDLFVPKAVETYIHTHKLYR